MRENSSLKESISKQTLLYEALSEKCNKNDLRMYYEENDKKSK